MTDCYANIRKALKAIQASARRHKHKRDSAYLDFRGACDPGTIRELSAERDQLVSSLEALRAEVEKLRALAACAYQMAGMHDAPLVWLDRLSDAANGDELPDVDTLMDELLPYQPGTVADAHSPQK